MGCVLLEIGLRISFDHGERQTGFFCELTGKGSNRVVGTQSHKVCKDCMVAECSCNAHVD